MGVFCTCVRCWVEQTHPTLRGSHGDWRAERLVPAFLFHLPACPPASGDITMKGKIRPHFQSWAAWAKQSLGSVLEGLQWSARALQ